MDIVWTLRSGVNILGWRTERNRIRYTKPYARYTHTHTHTPSWTDRRGSYGSKPQWVAPHKGSFVKTHCAPNTIQFNPKTLERRHSEEGEDWGLVIAVNCMDAIAAAYLGRKFITGINCEHTHTHTQKSLRAFGAWQAPSFSSKCDHEVLFHFCPFTNAIPDNLQKGGDHNSHTQIQSLTVLSLSSLHSFGWYPCRAQDENGPQFIVCCPWLHTVYVRCDNVLSQQDLFFTPIVLQGWVWKKKRGAFIKWVTICWN